MRPSQKGRTKDNVCPKRAVSFMPIPGMTVRIGVSLPRSAGSFGLRG